LRGKSKGGEGGSGHVGECTTEGRKLLLGSYTMLGKEEVQESIRSSRQNSSAKKLPSSEKRVASRRPIGGSYLEMGRSFLWGRGRGQKKRGARERKTIRGVKKGKKFRKVKKTCDPYNPNKGLLWKRCSKGDPERKGEKGA